MLKLNESRYDWQDKKSYIAIIIFIITWLLLIKRWSAIKVGHSTIAIFGCSLMVLFDIITSEETFSTCRETLLLVAAFMIIHLKLEQTSLAEFLKRVLLYGKPTPSWLLARVSILSGTLAALIMDNGSVTFLSPLVFHLCDENHLEIEPFMLALVTSANIGSVATVIGNVKNMIIAENVTEMSFSGFFIHMAPIAMIGLMLNTIFLMFYYRKRFIDQTIKSYKPSKATNIASKPTTSPRNATPTLRVITDSRTIETTYDSDEEAIVAGMISDSDEREESDTENNDDNDSQHSEGENSSLLARKKRLLHSKPHYANDFCSSPDRSPLKRNYAFEQVVYMDDNDNDDGGTSPWVIRRDNSSYNPRQNQPALTRFAWDAPHEPHGLQGLGSSIQKQTKQFISDTKSFFGNGGSFKKTFFILMMFGMYIAMFFEKSLGWTAVTVASLFLLFFDGKNSTNVINKINWGLIVYLIGIVGIIRGLHGTQLPHFLWDHYEGVFIRPDIKNIMSIFALSFISILLTLSLTSIPATLLLLPYMSEMMDERFAGFLLVWNIVLVGNLSAGKSSAGLIVSEIAKDHLFDTPLVQPHEFSTWGKYSVWSTVIISIVGTFIISFFH